MKNKICFLIDNIEDYGKLVSYCIEHDISVFRSYYIPGHYYEIDFDSNKLFHSNQEFYKEEGYILQRPKFIYTRYKEYILDFTFEVQ